MSLISVSCAILHNIIIFFHVIFVIESAPTSPFKPDESGDARLDKSPSHDDKKNDDLPAISSAVLSSSAPEFESDNWQEVRGRKVKDKPRTPSKHEVSWTKYDSIGLQLNVIEFITYSNI